MTTPLNRRIGRGQVAWTRAADEAVVQSSTATYVLDPTAAVLWQCLDGVSPLREVFADIAEVFAVPLAQVAADCLPAIDSWLATGIAVESGNASAQQHTPEQGRTWRRLVDPPNT